MGNDATSVIFNIFLDLRNLKCTWLVETALPEDDAYLVFEFRSQFLEQISAFNGDCFDYVKLDGLDSKYKY